MPDGTVLVADGANGRVVRINGDGRITVFVGAR